MPQIRGVRFLIRRAGTASSEASVAINDTPLDDINDIVSFATGSGTAGMKKYSLGVVSLRGPGNGRDLHLRQFGEKVSDFDTYSGDIPGAYGEPQCQR